MKLNLEENCEFVNGGAWGVNEYADEGYPVLKVSNFDKDSISFSDLSYLNVKSFEKYRRNQLRENDIVIATVGSHPSLVNSAAGRCLTIPKVAEGLLLNQNAICLRTNNPKVIDQRYLGYLCKSSSFQHFIQQRGKGAANQMRIPIGGIKSFQFDFPTITTQRKIASILSAYDKLIENNLKRIRLLEEKARLTYEEWFVRMKFPGHKNTPINKETGLPEGWEKVRLDEVLKASNGKSFKGKYIKEDKLPVYGSNGIIGQTDVFNNEEAIIIGRVGAYCGSIKYCKGRFWATDNTIMVTSKNGRMPNHLAYYILTNYDLQSMAGGAAQPLLTQRLVNSLEVIVPVKSISELFGKIAVDLFETILSLNKQNTLLKEARDLLLPRLMMGLVDVDELLSETVY